MTWSSSDEKVAKVDSNGKVEAIAEGTATITATANDGSGLTATCKVTIQKKVEDGIDNTSDTELTIQSQKGIITLTGLAEGTEVNVYDTTGRLVATATATDGTVTVNTKLAAGSTVIVKVAGHNMKVAL